MKRRLLASLLSAVLLITNLGISSYATEADPDYSVSGNFAVSGNEIVEEEEVSVEKLLDSIPETPLEELEVETKSETRKLIEKFVDENPEAAANLLRNWLNEDWGM